MERVDGYRSNSHVYIFNDHVYNENRRHGTTIYFTCRHRQDCPGRLILNNGVPQLRIAHNHDEDHAEAELCRFKTVLRRRARLENTSFEVIFREEERRYPEGARIMAGLSSFRSTMARARSLGTPRIPTTLVEYSAIIRQWQWFQRYGSDLSPEENAFFRGHVVGTDGSVSALFISHAILEHARGAAHVTLHMDATFKVVPNAGLQLFTVHILYDDMTFPLLYAIMDRKTRAAYCSVLLHLRQVLGNVIVRDVMADYEAAMRIAIITTFRGTTLRGCWFHFARAVFKKSRDLGLQRPDIRITSRPIIRAAMALPLLPRNMLVNGVAAIEAMGAQANIDVALFINYLRRQWLPLQVSVHGQFHRTNNSVESFHRQLYRLIARAHPNIWIFTEKIKEMEHAKATDLYRLLNGAMMPHRRRRRYMFLEQRIRRAEERLEIDGNIHRFLLWMGNSVGQLERVMNRIPDLPVVEAPVAAQVQVVVQPALPVALGNIVQPPAVAENVVQPAVAAQNVILPVVVAQVNVTGQNTAPPPIASIIEVAAPQDLEQPIAASLEEIPPELKCSVCRVNAKSILMVDCRHLCMCEDCAAHYRVREDELDDYPSTRCPLCRVPITSQPIRVFI